MWKSTTITVTLWYVLVIFLGAIHNETYRHDLYIILIHICMYAITTSVERKESSKFNDFHRTSVLFRLYFPEENGKRKKDIPCQDHQRASLSWSQFHVISFSTWNELWICKKVRIILRKAFCIITIHLRYSFIIIHLLDIQNCFPSIGWWE